LFLYTIFVAYLRTPQTICTRK